MFSKLVAVSFLISSAVATIFVTYPVASTTAATSGRINITWINDASVSLHLSRLFF
jgi:hypothetical protein